MVSTKETKTNIPPDHCKNKHDLLSDVSKSTVDKESSNQKILETSALPKSTTPSTPKWHILYWWSNLTVSDENDQQDTFKTPESTFYYTLKEQHVPSLEEKIESLSELEEKAATKEQVSKPLDSNKLKKRRTKTAYDVFRMYGTPRIRRTKRFPKNLKVNEIWGHLTQHKSPIPIFLCL